jgi:DNA helicase-2/ATP-dependent DNA helicase PcrA
MELTLEQKKIVYSNCKINVVSAIPGGGKSTTLIARTIRLWNEFREPTLICTFSKKAADDIYRRLGGNYSDMVEVKTIHSLCYSIVRDNWETLGQIVGKESWPHEPVLATRNEELALITELFPKTSPEKFFNKLDEFRKWPITPAAAIRMMKQGIYLGKYSIRDLENWAYFEDERISRGTITFDDMTNLANLLVPLPEVSTKLANKYSHVLIDEAQDTSENQWAVLRPLVLGATTTLAVGDLNQSLYGFRSADGSVMNSLSKMNDAVNFTITEAFRSGSAITNLANMLAWNKDNKIKALERKGKTVLQKFETAEEEVIWVMDNIKNGSVILSRTNSYLEKFERKALELNIPYRGNGFYRSSHIKDLFQFVSQINQDDLKPIITKAYIENNSYSKIEKEDFKLALEIITKQGKDYFANLVEKSELLDNDGIVLMTGHGAKGLEWDDVYAVGVHPGNIPHRLSKDEREERNILYVIITRAKNNLYISAIKEFSHFIPGEYLETV